MEMLNFPSLVRSEPRTQYLIPPLLLTEHSDDRVTSLKSIQRDVGLLLENAPTGRITKPS